MKLMLLFLLVLSPLNLFADEVSEPFQQTEHRVSVDLKDRVAKVRIERIFENTSKEDQNLKLYFSLPDSAALTSLQTFEGGKWRKAKIHVYQDAYEKYETSTGNPKAKGVSSLLLVRTSRYGKYTLFASPVTGRSSLRISYDVEIPFEYNSGKYHFAAESLFAPLPGTKPIILKTKDRFMFRNVLREPGVTYSIFQNECEKLGVPSDCLIREIEVPFLKKPVFRAKYISNKQGLNYWLVPPSKKLAGKATSLRRPWKSTPQEKELRESLPAEVGKWRFVVWNEGRGTGRVENIRIESGKQVYVPSAEEMAIAENKKQNSSEVWLLKSKKGNSKTRARLGGIRHKEHNFLEVKLDLAERLSELPVSPVLIFVIDTSISQDFLGVLRQINVAKSIANHFDDHTVKVVTYNRKAQITGMNLATFSSEFRKKSGAFLSNGSNLHEGLKLAADLEGAVKKNPVLIYVMTDLLLKKSYTAPDFLLPLKRLRKSTTVHLLNVQEEEGDTDIKVTRDNTIPLSKIASTHLGVAVNVSIPSVYTSDLKIKDLSTRYLVRPDRLDEIEVVGWQDKKQTTLEGERFRLDSHWGKYKTKIMVSAKLWNKKKTFRIKHDKRGDRSTLLAYAASPKRVSPTLEIVGKKGEVVTLFTSFYIPGKAKASGRVQRRMELGSQQAPPVILKMAKPTGLFQLDAKKVFSSVLSNCKEKGGNETFGVIVETTLSEIVSVSPGLSPFSKCISKGIWKVRLPDTVKVGTYTVVFSTDGTIKLK